jgi:hypothetical protein
VGGRVGSSGRPLQQRPPLQRPRSAALLSQGSAATRPSSWGGVLTVGHPGAGAKVCAPTTTTHGLPPRCGLGVGGAATGAGGMVGDHRRQTACGHHVAPAQKVEDLAELGYRYNYM